MNNETCYCKDRHAIVIDRRLASRVTSCLALGAFFVFATGYFIGKRQVLQDDLEQQQRTLFANRSAYALDEQCHMTKSSENESVCQQDERATLVHSPEKMPLITADMQHSTLCHDANDNVQYIAKLAGYQTQRSAQQFVQRLKKRGINAEVKTRVSTNAQKKSSTWYQVVTQKYANRQELSSLVEQLKEQEHLGDDIGIIEIT